MSLLHTIPAARGAIVGGIETVFVPPWQGGTVSEQCSSQEHNFSDYMMERAEGKQQLSVACLPPWIYLNSLVVWRKNSMKSARSWKFLLFVSAAGYDWLSDVLSHPMFHRKCFLLNCSWGSRSFLKPQTEQPQEDECALCDIPKHMSHRVHVHEQHSSNLLLHQTSKEPKWVVQATIITCYLCHPILIPRSRLTPCPGALTGARKVF